MTYNKNIADLHDNHGRRLTSVAETKEGIFIVGWDADYITKEGWFLDDMDKHTGYSYYTFDDRQDAINFAYSHYKGGE